MRPLYLWKAGRRVKVAESPGPLKGMTWGEESQTGRENAEFGIQVPRQQQLYLFIQNLLSLPTCPSSSQKGDGAQHHQDHLLNIWGDECQVQCSLMYGWRKILLSFNNGDSNELIFKKYRNPQD